MYLLCLGLTVFLALIPSFGLGLPFISHNASLVAGTRRSFNIPIQRSRVHKRGTISGSIGLGDSADLLYTVPIELGNTVTAVHLDTGSSDLWVISDACHAETCKDATVSRYQSSSLNNSGASVTMHYGDSTTGTYAGGPIGIETATIAGVTMTDQYFAAINATTNPTVRYGAAGIFGLGFPSGSEIQHSLVLQQFDKPKTTDQFIASTYANGPLLARIAMTDQLEMPMFSITLQRNTIDIGGHGMLTVGKLPDGIDNSSLTWVPVRLYSAKEGGVRPPTFAPNEVYPFRWEIDIDGVFLDGQKVPDSTIPGRNMTVNRVSALIDTGNSLLRGPADVVQNILSTVSPSYASSSDPKAHAYIPCSVPRTLAFQIDGKMFPVDPRDFIGPTKAGDTNTCVADNIVPTDPPGKGALFSWSLGDPFLKSNLVAFHYGNLTHPSVDPPRIGFLSLVPANADNLLTKAIEDAQQNGGNFESTIHLAPTASAAAEGQITVSASETASQLLAQVTSVLTPTSLPGSKPTTAGPVGAKIGESNSASLVRPSYNYGLWFFVVAAFIYLV